MSGMSKAGWIAIRVDGSARIGTGHVMRCLTLADSFARRGIECVFVCRHLDGSLPEWLAASGHEVVVLPDEGPQPRPEQGEYGVWLGTTQERDAITAIAALAPAGRRGPPHFILVDHYGLDSIWEGLVRRQMETALVAIDDLDRPHDCAYLIDTTYGKTGDSYDGRVPQECVVMAGANYALLRPAFAQIRDEALARRDAAFDDDAPVKTLLIAMGGADVDNATGWMLNAVEQSVAGHGVHTHVLVGAAFAHRGALENRTASFSAPLTVHRDIRDVAQFMAGMDLCIGAAGSSTWERCCLGLPTINVVLADNQTQIASALADAGAVADGGRPEFGGDRISPGDWGKHLLEPLLTGRERRRALSLAARDVTDGWGAMRVVSRIFGDAVRRTPVTLRPAEAGDAALVYEWQCFPETRRFAVNPEVPLWQDHEAWMQSKVKEAASSFYIICADEIPAGVVRLDAAEGRSPPDIVAFAGAGAKEVSILTAPEFYGCGVAYRALTALKERHCNDTIVAHVFAENRASRALFSKARFLPYNEEYFVWRGKSNQSDISGIKA